MSEEQKEKLRNINTLYNIEVYTKDGNLVKTYNSVAEAVSDGYEPCGIRRCYRGRLKTYRGLVWKKIVKEGKKEKQWKIK